MSQQNFSSFIWSFANILKCDYTLTLEAQRGLELLQERRMAFVCADITGKIDVRFFVQAEAT